MFANEPRHSPLNTLCLNVNTCSTCRKQLGNFLFFFFLLPSPLTTSQFLQSSYPTSVIAMETAIKHLLMWWFEIDVANTCEARRWISELEIMSPVSRWSLAGLSESCHGNSDESETAHGCQEVGRQVDWPNIPVRYHHCVNTPRPAWSHLLLLPAH